MYCSFSLRSSIAKSQAEAVGVVIYARQRFSFSFPADLSDKGLREYSRAFDRGNAEYLLENYSRPRVGTLIAREN